MTIPKDDKLKVTLEKAVAKHLCERAELGKLETISPEEARLILQQQEKRSKEKILK